MKIEFDAEIIEVNAGKMVVATKVTDHKPTS